jgi:TPR repeat protein
MCGTCGKEVGIEAIKSVATITKGLKRLVGTNPPAGSAKRRGLAVAQSQLGSMYFNGIGVKKDYFEAIRLYRLAAAANEMNAVSTQVLGFRQSDST